LTERGADYLAEQESDANFFVLPDIGSVLIEIDADEEMTPEEKATEKSILMQDFTLKSKRLHSMRQLLKAYTLFHLDDQYIIEDDKVVIVDESTGRKMAGRRWSQ